MNKCKHDTWQKFVNEVNEYDIWKVNNYLNTILINIFIFTLKDDVIMNEQKTNTLKKIFFSSSSSTDLSDISNTNYPDLITTNLNIIIMQVKRVIDKLSSNKTLESNEIPNHILKQCLPNLQYHILTLAQ